MGKCLYCGKEAGIFFVLHHDCMKLHSHGIDSATKLIKEEMSDSGNLITLESNLEELTSKNYLNSEEIRALLVKEWESAVDKVLEDGILTNEEENKLQRFKLHFQLKNEEVNVGLQKLVKAAVIRDILAGKLPQPISIKENIPINMQKNEFIVWTFPNTLFYEDVEKKGFIGGTAGFSIRVAKGLYFKIGGFKGQPISNKEKTLIATGIFAITNKNIYFLSEQTSFKINYKKIITFIPYENGIGIQKEGVRAKLQTFVTGDGWFTLNLLSNLSQLFIKN